MIRPAGLGGAEFLVAEGGLGSWSHAGLVQGGVGLQTAFIHEE